MRRFAVVLGVLVACLWVAPPASAFAHDQVHNVYLHAALDVLTLGVVTAPMWTAYWWGGAHRWLLPLLVAAVQVPVAVVAFVPVLPPAVHASALVAALALTAASLYAVRRAAPSPAAAPAPAGEPG
ncbi:hypothetical protein [Rhizomonospora bruguierae]|uniref:hypothetical protein n=1 Tax=Rhizomonospora bruguierae TaxID=1581705 RepID=UPI001BCAC2BA|nr:hypothetical protein [Micromonospora sp. NBRC 107566]